MRSRMLRIRRTISSVLLVWVVSACGSGDAAGPGDAGAGASEGGMETGTEAGPAHDAAGANEGGRDADSGDGGTSITCATLAAQQTLTTGQRWVLDLTGAPVCKLTANTDLVLGGTGTRLLVENGTLEVQGNIKLSGTSLFTVSSGTLQIDNITNFTRDIISSDNATMIIDHSTIVTNATGTNNVGSVYTGSGTSSAQFLFAKLLSTTSWLLAATTESASLLAKNSNVPDEIYIQDGSSVTIQDDQVPSDLRAQNGLWLTFENGSVATVTLPNVSAPFTWSAGRGQSGYTNVGWSLQVDTASPGIGIEPHVRSSVTVVGHGLSQKEVGFSVHIDPASGSAIADALASTPYALSKPPLGMISSFALPVVPGATGSELTLQSVNVGALAWQIYVGGGTGSPPITVDLGAGAFNEVAAFAGGTVNLSGTTMQLAVLEATGAGAVVNATNSDLWNQTIQADSSGTVNLIGSRVHGSSLVATNGGILSMDSATELWADGVTTAPNCVFGANYTHMLANNGTPLCNPYSNPTKMSSRTVGKGSSLTPGSTHPACPWSITAYAPALDFEVGPAVSSASPGTVSCVANSGGATVTPGSVDAYPYLLMGAQASTTYACTLTAGTSSKSFSVTSSACTP